jgi:flavin-dependent dehydrogenase
LPLYSADRSLSVETAENGWWYLCPGENRRSLACYITDAAALRVHQLPHVGIWNDLFYSTRLSRRFERKVPAISLNAAPVGIMALRQTHGLRWIAVGDAAVKLDPISSSGVSTALASGQRAAQAVADALHGSMAALDRYGHWVSNLFQEHIRQRGRHYAIEASRRAGRFWGARAHDLAYRPVPT